MSLLQTEFIKLKEYYDSLSWSERYFFPDKIASILNDNFQDYHDLTLYYAVKNNTSWFQRYFFSGITDFFEHIKNTEKTIEFLDRHQLIHYYVGDERAIDDSRYQKEYEWIISKNEMDKNTSKAALLLIELKRTNITSQLENQIGKIAQALARHTKEDGTLTLDPTRLFQLLIESPYNKDNISQPIIGLLEAGLLDGEHCWDNLKFLSDSELSSNLSRLIYWLSTSSQLNLMTQARYNQILSKYTDISTIESIICLLTNQYHRSAKDNSPNFLSEQYVDYILSLDSQSLRNLLAIVRILSQTNLFNQKNLDTLFQNFLLNEFGNRGAHYREELRSVFESNLLAGPNSQINFDAFNRYYLEPEHSLIQLSNLRGITQDKFDHYINQTPKERNAQYENKIASIGSYLYPSLRTKSIFSSPHIPPMQIHPDEPDRPGIRNEPIAATQLDLIPFYF